MIVCRYCIGRRSTHRVGIREWEEYQWEHDPACPGRAQALDCVKPAYVKRVEELAAIERLRENT